MQNLSLEVSTQSSHALEDLVDVELAKLVHHDSVEFPLLDTNEKGRTGVLIRPTWRWCSWSCQNCHWHRARSSGGFPSGSANAHPPSKSWIYIVDNRERFTRLWYRCADMERSYSSWSRLTATRIFCIPAISSVDVILDGYQRLLLGHTELFIVEVLEWKPFADVRNCGRRRRILKWG